MAASKYDEHRRHLEFMLLPDLVLNQGTGGGGARGGTFLEVDARRYLEVFKECEVECPTLRKILDKSEDKNLKIDQLFAGFVKIHLYLRCSLPLCDARVVGHKLYDVVSIAVACRKRASIQ